MKNKLAPFHGPRCKWIDAWSQFFDFDLGIRQGSVISPFLFALYLDELARSSSLCRGMFIVLYADDILSISMSIRMIEKLVRICEHELDRIHMAINVLKIVPMRIGPRNDFS